MKPVYQTSFGEGKGNCLSAAIASLLEIDTEEVPNFAEYGSGFWREVHKWLRDHNMGMFVMTGKPAYGYCLITVKSPRGDFNHALVGFEGEPVHDPYPGGDCEHKGIVGYSILYPLDPAKPMGMVPPEDGGMQ